MPQYSPMQPNPSSAAGRSQPAAPQKTTPVAPEPGGRSATPPARWELILRPFGYLLVAVIWLALWLATLALPALLPLGLRAGNPDYTLSNAFQGANMFVLALFALFCLEVLVPLLGYAFIALPLATGPLAVLALTYLVRSVRRRYASERLSATGWSRDALGPITVFPVALSLIPRRLTGWTRFWLGAGLMGWLPSLRLLLAGCVYGFGYFLTIGWMLWPVHSVGLSALWWVVTALFALAALGLVIQAARARFSAAPSTITAPSPAAP